MRPHVLAVDDGAFDKFRDTEVPVVAVVTEGADLVEAIAVRTFPVDGDDATGFLADWIGGLRIRPALHAVVLGGITLAGLGVVDVRALHGRLGLPILVANRADPRRSRLPVALRAAGLEERIPLVENTPDALRIDDRLHLTPVGIEPDAARALIAATRQKSALPEPLRLAHLVARAVTTGESRGRP